VRATGSGESQTSAAGDPLETLQRQIIVPEFLNARETDRLLRLDGIDISDREVVVCENGYLSAWAV